MLGKRIMYTGSADRSHEWTLFVILILPLVASACIISRWSAVPHNPLSAAAIIIPLFLAIRLLSPFKAALEGFLWSCVLFLHLVTVAAAPDGQILIQGLLLLVVPALYAYAGAHYTRRYGFQPLALALGWIVVELALHPAGFRRGLLPSCCGDGIIQRAAADFLGYGFVAFLVVLVNAMALALTIRLYLRASIGRQYGRHSDLKTLSVPDIKFLIAVSPSRTPGPRAPPYGYG